MWCRFLISKRFYSAPHIPTPVSSAEFRSVYPSGATPALFAFRARVRLDRLDLNDIANCTRSTESNFSQSVNNGKTIVEESMRLRILQQHPVMPESLAKAAVSDLVVDSQVEKISRTIGFHEIASTADQESIQRMPFSLINLIHREMGANAASSFACNLFMPIAIDWETVIQRHKMVNLLDEIVHAQYGCEAVTRLIGESGRESPLPVFVVGVFANTAKIGEGFGQSLAMAQHRARVNALANCVTLKSNQ